MLAFYQRSGWFTTNVFNRLVAALTRVGVSVYGSRVLEVQGRKSGEWRQTPVNLLHYRGGDYLVAPRGHTQWVKNLRASGQGRLRVGRRTQPFTAVELADEEKVPVLRAYLKKWKFEVGAFFGGVGPDDDEGDRLLSLTSGGLLGAVALGMSISLDELAIGFSAGLLRLPIAALVIAVALQAFVFTLIGLRVGGRVTETLREATERLAGVALLVLGSILLVEQLS